MATRRFTRAQDSIDFGSLEQLGGLTRLTLRVLFQSAPPPPPGVGKPEPSIALPFSPREGIRAWVSQWGEQASDQVFLLGQDPSEPLGSIFFAVGDGQGNVARLSTQRTIWDGHDAHRPLRELVATWRASGEMRLDLDGALLARAHDQAAVSSTPKRPTSRLTFGAQPGGPYHAAVGLELGEISLWRDVLHTRKGLASLSGGLEILPRDLIAACIIEASGPSEDLRAPGGEILARGAASMDRPLAPPLPSLTELLDRRSVPATRG